MTTPRASSRRTTATVAAFLVLGGVAVVAGLDLVSQRQRAHLVVVAENTADPDGLMQLSRAACPDATYLVRCGRSPQDVATVARHYQAALSQAGGQAAANSCATPPAGATPRVCAVRVTSGDHTLLILVDSWVDRSPGSDPFTGSRIRIEVD